MNSSDADERFLKPHYSFWIRKPYRQKWHHIKISKLASSFCKSKKICDMQTSCGTTFSIYWINSHVVAKVVGKLQIEVLNTDFLEMSQSS